VRSASDPARIERHFGVRDEAVATSGDYERYFRFHGHSYHHLLDAATAAPRETLTHSVTVKAQSCMAADAAATAAFGGVDEGVLRRRGVRLA